MIQSVLVDDRHVYDHLLQLHVEYDVLRNDSIRFVVYRLLDERWTFKCPLRNSAISALRLQQ